MESLEYSFSFERDHIVSFLSSLRPLPKTKEVCVTTPRPEFTVLQVLDHRLHLLPFRRLIHRSTYISLKQMAMQQLISIGPDFHCTYHKEKVTCPLITYHVQKQEKRMFYLKQDSVFKNCTV